jgi:hypothetical protein
MGTPSLMPPDTTKQEMQAIYNGLTSDLKASVANAGGPDALTAFNRANAYRAAMQGRMEKLAGIIGIDGEKTGERVFQRLADMAGTKGNADVRTLGIAKRSMSPDQWQEVQSGVIQRLGRANPNAEFSADRFVTQWNQLSDAGKQTLFSDPTLRRSLDAIATLSSASKKAERYANRSNTGRTVFGVGMLTGAMAHPVGMLAAAIGGDAAARILSQPATAAAAAKWAQQVIQAQRAGAAGARTLQRVTINFAEQAGIPQAANDLLKAITRAAAGNNQDQPGRKRPVGQIQR